jgi:hypothetical protein
MYVQTMWISNYCKNELCWAIPTVCCIVITMLFFCQANLMKGSLGFSLILWLEGKQFAQNLFLQIIM